MMKLYDFLPCPFGQKVRVILAEKGLSYDLVEVDLIQGEQRRPEFRRLNPFGRVPVLVDEDTAVYDSTIIAEYLEDEYPEPPLLPALSSSALRAQARIWEDIADTSFTVQVGQLMTEMAKAELDRDSNRITRLNQWIEQMLSFLNHQLQGQDFLASQFSVADIGFVPRLLVLKELGIDPSANRGNIEGWFKRLLERPSVQNLQGITAQPLAGV
jgi:glutathione S-transferase